MAVLRAVTFCKHIMPDSVMGRHPFGCGLKGCAVSSAVRLTSTVANRGGRRGRRGELELGHSESDRHARIPPMRTFDVAIVGAGVMGVAAACELAREGVSVALIDQSELPNPRAASVDHSKVFRFAYPDPFYVRLAVDSLKRWRKLEEETGTRLLTQTGALLIGKHRPSFETECYEAMRAEGCAVELLDRQRVASRFPQFRALEYGVFVPSGAITHAEIALRALIDLARRRGVTIIESTRVVDVRNTE